MATHLLVEGLTSPSLAELVGLDLAPFETEDARRLLDNFFVETGTHEPSRSRRIEVVSA